MHWDAIAQALAADFRVLAPDERVHGASKWLPPHDVTTGSSGDGSHDRRATATVATWLNDEQPGWWGMAPTLRCPTLVVGGATSRLPQAASAKLAQHIRSSRLEVLPAGHGVHDEEPVRFTATVRHFLTAP